MTTMGTPCRNARIAVPWPPWVTTRAAALHDRVVRRVVEHDGIRGRCQLIRRDDTAGGRDHMDRQIRQRIESALKLVDVRCSKPVLKLTSTSGVGSSSGQGSGVGTANFSSSSTGPAWRTISQPGAGGASNAARLVEMMRSRGPPQLVERRQAGETRLLAHAVELRDHPAPHVELAKHEGVDEHRRRASEARALAPARRETSRR